MKYIVKYYFIKKGKLEEVPPSRVFDELKFAQKSKELWEINDFDDRKFKAEIIEQTTN